MGGAKNLGRWLVNIRSVSLTLTRGMAMARKYIVARLLVDTPFSIAITKKNYFSFIVHYNLIHYLQILTTTS